MINVSRLQQLVLPTLAALTLSSCMPRQQEMVIENGVWRVELSGALDSSGGHIFGENAVVAFEVYRGETEYAAGELYSAGPHDRSFRNRYPQSEWVRTNILRFFVTTQPTSVPRYEVRVLNRSSGAIRWLRMRSDDLLLIFDVQVKGEFTLRTTQHYDPSLLVEGEFEDGRSFRSAPLLIPGSAQEVFVVVGDHDLKMEPK